MHIKPFFNVGSIIWPIYELRKTATIWLLKNVPQHWANEESCEIMRSLGVFPEGLGFQPCIMANAQAITSLDRIEVRYLRTLPILLHLGGCLHQCNSHVIAWSRMGSRGRAWNWTCKWWTLFPLWWSCSLHSSVPGHVHVPLLCNVKGKYFIKCYRITQVLKWLPIHKV